MKRALIPVHLDRARDVPLPVQLAAALREAIDAAVLRPGEEVPATREFASRLGVARGVVVAAYEQLIAEGYLAASRGRGTLVNPELTATQLAFQGPPKTVSDLPARRTQQVSTGSNTPGPLAPGRPITDAVDSAAWRSAWRSAAAHAHLAAPSSVTIGCGKRSPITCDACEAPREARKTCS
ncbi:GntR family transcriptional regulator [Leucobacter insecticola]|uniref:GntR family transcriptional regulator n=1 Tax=Leucobacter insecticola TaxID=2714934 RepID=UPI001FCC2D5C|nr:winged helix-turn-helix domain-containing protein [Leucobacter insecticola]